MYENEYIKKSTALYIMRNNIGTYDAMEDAMEQIRKSKAEDVQPVVRCKDCKNNYVTTRNHGKQDDPRCDFTDRRLSLDDFCSRGERRIGGGT